MIKYLIESVLLFGLLCKVESYGSNSCCQDGWVKYGDSCFLVLRDKLSFDGAEHACATKNSHLVMTLSKEIFDNIKVFAPTGTHFWIGARATRSGSELAPTLKWVNQWPVTHQDNELIPWLTKTGIPSMGNGFASTSNVLCVGYMNYLPPTSGYAYYYDCDNMKFNAICEINNSVRSRLGERIVETIVQTEYSSENRRSRLSDAVRSRLGHD